MAISFVGTGSPGGGTGDVTPTLPSGLQAQDFMLLLVETGGPVDGGETVGTPSGWTSLGASGPAQGASGQGATRLSMFYRFYQSGDGNPTITDPGDHVISQIAAFRGVDLVTPATTRQFSSSSNATTRTSAAVSAVADQWLCIIGVNSLNQLPTITNSAGLTQTQRVLLTTTNGDDGALRFYTAPVASAASITGTTTVASSDALLVCAFALNPLSTNNHTASGALGSVAAGTMSVENQYAVTVSGALGAVAAGTMSVEKYDNQNVTLSAALGPIAGSGSLDPIIEVSVEGALGPIGGSGSLDPIIEVSVDASLAALEGTGQVDPVIEVSQEATGALGAVEAGTMEMELGDIPCYVLTDDKRELILKRLEVILAAVPGVVTFGRNDPTVPESKLPAVLLLDADEEAYLPTYGRGRPARGPNYVTMRPEVHVLVEENPADLGDVMNTLSERITDAVLNDATLQSLCKDDEAEYEGAGMSLDIGRKMVGEMQLNFSFTYVLWPVDAPCQPYNVPIEPEGETAREQILDTLHKVLGNVPNVVVALRNDVTVPEFSTPAIVLLDGDEEADSGASQHSHPGHATNIVRMGPEIYIIAQDRPDLAGPKLNEIRMMVIRYIFNDPTLRSLLYSGDLRYEGCQTSLALGRSLTGEMGMIISAARKRD